MTGIRPGARVRVVSFDAEGLTGSVFKGSRNPVGKEGVAIDYDPTWRDCPWEVSLDEAPSGIFPCRYSEEELEVIK